MIPKIEKGAFLEKQNIESAFRLLDPNITPKGV